MLQVDLWEAIVDWNEVLHSCKQEKRTWHEIAGMIYLDVFDDFQIYFC